MSQHPAAILHLVRASDAGGLSRYVYDLCAAMHAQGHHVAVAGGRGAWHRLFEDAPWPWIDLPLNGSAMDVWRGVRQLRKYLRHNPVDILHSHYRRTNLVSRWVNWRLHPPVPTLFTLHSSCMPLLPPHWALCGLGDHVHAISQGASQWLQADTRIAPDRITIIPHGINIDRFPRRTRDQRESAREELGLPHDARVAAYVGRFDDPKNADWLLDLAPQMPELILLLVGEGPQEADLHRRIGRGNLAGRVHLLPTQDPLKIYQAADALLLPSGREGFSLVCAEAMSVGVPVLRTRTSGTSELIIENVTGRSTPINRDAFITAAQEFLADSQSLERMGEAAAEHIRANFTFEKQVRETLALYRRLIQAGQERAVARRPS